MSAHYKLQFNFYVLGGVLTEYLPAHFESILHLGDGRRRSREGGAGTWWYLPLTSISTFFIHNIGEGWHHFPTNHRQDKVNVLLYRMFLKEDFILQDPEVLKKARRTAKTKINCAYKLVRQAIVV